MNETDYLTELQHDWGQRNLMALQNSLRETDTAMLLRTDIEADPLLDTPNLPNVRGVLRWAILQKIIENHISAGRYPGISGNWISLGGSSVLELTGDCTSVTACHLRHEDEVPREATYRKNKRRLNAGPQRRLAFDEETHPEPSPSNRIHITLVYGGREEEFAYFRAYFDEENRSYYHKLSQNIMKLPRLLSTVETESIEDPQIELGLKLRTVRFEKGA